MTGALSTAPVSSEKHQTLITDEYRALNAELHERNPLYGVSGQQWAREVLRLALECKAEDILDYGCGKQTLAEALTDSDYGVAGNALRFTGKKIIGYDPALEGLDEPPEPADLVICGDVLEHIEPECLDAVLDDLARVTKKTLFVVVSTIPAKKKLKDGRNAHLIVKPMEWWMPKIAERFHVKRFVDHGGEFSVVAGPEGSRYAEEVTPSESATPPKANGEAAQVAPTKGHQADGVVLREPLRICIGFDHRQIVSFTALVQSIIVNATVPVAITPLVLNTLPVRRAGLTPFTYSRFIVPAMFGFEGVAAFLDVDQMVLGDVAELFAQADDRYAVHVVRNPNPKFSFEWASVMLFNCAHADNRKLTIEEIDGGQLSLHKIGWTEAIGDLPLAWNELVGYTDEYERDYEDLPKLAHFTQGVPAYPETVDSPYVELWQRYAQTAMSTQPWPSLMGDSVHAKPVIARLKRTGNIDKLGSTLLGPQEAPTPEVSQ